MGLDWLKEKIKKAFGEVIYGWMKIFISSALLLFLLALVTLLVLLLKIDKPPTYTHSPYKIANHWKSYPKTGIDNQNLYAKFIFVALSDRFSWEKGSTNVIIYNKKRLSGEGFKTVVLSDLYDFISRSGGLITIGTSSQEGELQEEEIRALQRADHLAGWLKPLMPSANGLYRLSLGQYNKRCHDCDRFKTNYQRPAVIVFIIDWESGVDMGQALANAMSKLRDLPHLDDYSAFDFREIRKIKPPEFNFYIMLENWKKIITDKFKLFF